MTARILPFPSRPRSSKPGEPRPHAARRPYELVSSRLYLTRETTSAAAASDRAYRLYVEGAPCTRQAWCVLSAGHDGGCCVEPDRLDALKRAVLEYEHVCASQDAAARGEEPEDA